MRINIGGHKLIVAPDKTTKTLAELLAKGGLLRGEIRRLTSSSAFIFLQNSEFEVEVPLSTDNHSLVVGQIVELMKQGEQGVEVRVLPAESIDISAKGDVQVITSSQLEQVLVELNIPATAETIQVAEGLIQREFPLQDSLIWSLLPWAEKGLLDEAFLALEAKFPLRLELLEVIRDFQAQKLEQPILKDARNEFTSDLQEVFSKPTWENRSKWSDRFLEGDVFKALSRLLVEERFAEALENNQGKVSQFEYIFALPFLRGEDLYASWIHITPEQDSTNKAEADQGVFRVELKIPTIAFGVIKAELIVSGKNVTIIFEPEDQSQIVENSFDKLEQELEKSGWKLTKLQVRGWSDA